ncbi:MAG TPA: hypothetical protein VIU38_01440 [Anaerolineales bacterium]
MRLLTYRVLLPAVTIWALLYISPHMLRRTELGHSSMSVLVRAYLAVLLCAYYIIVARFWSC